MARRTTTPDLKLVRLSDAEANEAVSKLERRLKDFEALDLNSVAEQNNGHELEALAQKTNATLMDIYGDNSIQYRDLHVSLTPDLFVVMSGMDTSIRGNMDEVRENVKAAYSKLTTQVEILKEQTGSSVDEPVGRSIKAYEGLDLHKEISRAASKLYLDGHYANAVESAVKALNGLVRMRSGLEVDGSKLMEQAFGGKAPKIAFNDLANDSATNEQRGFMMLFSGAVAGLRNPRAHGFIEDSPDRALEFIAFISLLAKILDEAD